MEIVGEFNVFLVGLLGGASNELLHWWNLRRKPTFPAYASSLRYWLVTLFMAGLGGVLAWLQLGAKANGLIAFQLGLAAPLLLQKLAASVPEPAGAKGVDDQGSLRDFITW